MSTWWSSLRRALRNAMRRRLVARQQGRRRGSLASATEVRQIKVAELEAEVYRLRVNGVDGVGASVYIGDEELLRFDCLGADGHFHMNVRQSNWVADLGVPRIAFLTDSVAEQTGEACVHLRRNLRNAIDSNWHPQVRTIAVANAAIEALASRVAIEFTTLIGADGTNGTVPAMCD